MSEYQYYEFLAIDRPLTTEEMAALRALSTRAHITPVSFTNEYQWGGFKGNPDDLMRRFFDAHVYVANWMRAVFMVRVPIEAIPTTIIETMEEDGFLDFDITKTYLVITWRLEESENYDRFGMEDGRSWMARLTPVRDELLSGDMRSIYIGWLAAITQEMVDDDDLEPLPSDGLGSLTAAQQALVEFLDVDKDLLTGAVIGSPDLQTEEFSQKEIDDWLGNLPSDEVLTLLKQLLEGQGLKVERTLKNRFSAWRRGSRGNRDETPRRSVEELKKNAETVKKKRLELEQREQEQRKTRRRKEREAYLANLAKDFPKAWKVTEQQVARGSRSAYDEACRTLVNIAEAYALHANKGDFSQKLKQFMAGHIRR
ncbi:MAG: hypothetical protein Q8N95_05860, partial [Desulfobacterales bacterium]|nr:hypothetical protein [Desulfobacterales bacterium]